MPHLNMRRSVNPQRYAQQLERHRAGEARRLEALRLRLRRGAALLGVLLGLALILHTSAIAQQRAEIKISRLAGSVEVLHAKQTGGKWEAAERGQAIANGWKLRTGEDGKVQLLFPLDNTVIVKSNSVLTVDKLDLGGGAETSMDSGSLLADLKTALSPGSEFEIKTPSALATVRGTQFAVLLDPGGEDEGQSTGQTRQVTVVQDMNPVAPDDLSTAKETQGATFGEKVNQGLQSAGSARANDRLKNAGPQDGWPTEDGGGTYTMEFMVLEGQSLEGNPLGDSAGKGLAEVRDFSSIDNAPEEKERGSMSGAQSNPLYEEQGNTGENPLYEGQNRQSPDGGTAPFTPEELFGSQEDHPLWLPAEAMGDGSVRLGDGSVFPDCISIDEPGISRPKGKAVFVADINGELVLMMVSPEGPGGGGSGGSGGSPSAHIIGGPCGGSAPVPVPYPGGPGGGGGGTVVIDGGGGGGGGSSVPTSTGDEAGTLGGVATGTVTGGPGRGSGTVKFPGGGRLVMPGLRNEAAEMEFWDDELGRWVSGGPGLGALLGGFYGEEGQRITRTRLKEFFETGDMPTQQQFAAMIDSLVHASEDRGLLGLKEFNPAQDQLKGNPRHIAAPGGGGGGGGWGNPLAGIDDWKVGDWVIYNGSAWEKVDNTDDGGGSAALKKEEGGRHTPFHNKYRPMARLYGYEGTVAVENELGSQSLTQGKTIDVSADGAPGAPVDSGPDAQAFLADALDTSAFEMQEVLDSADNRLQQIADKLIALETRIQDFEKNTENVSGGFGLAGGGGGGGGTADATNVQYNPKEVGLDKSVPWQKAKGDSADDGSGGGGGGAAELTGRPVGQPAAAGLGSHVQREPKWVADVRGEIRVLEDEYLEVLEDLATDVSALQLKLGAQNAGVERPGIGSSSGQSSGRRFDPIMLDLNGDGVTEAVVAIGDTDSDGDVDGRDFLAWQRGFGATGGDEGPMTYAALGGMSGRGSQSGKPKTSFASKLGGFAKTTVVIDFEDGTEAEAEAYLLGDLDGDGVQEMLLPAVQKVRAAAVPTADAGLDQAGALAIAEATDAVLIGLLLPAVQKVREAALQPDANGDLAIAQATDEVLIGMLLPAIQKVRDSANRSSSGGTHGAGGGGGAGKVSWSDLSFMGDEELAALLLPAVQKIREAAATGGSAGKATPKEFTITKKTDTAAAMLLPAVQKIREAAARASSSNQGWGKWEISGRVLGLDEDGDGLGDSFSGKIIPVIPVNRPESGPPVALLLLSGGESPGNTYGGLTTVNAGVLNSLGQPGASDLLDEARAALGGGGGGAGGMSMLLLEADPDGDGSPEPIGSVATVSNAQGTRGQATGAPHRVLPAVQDGGIVIEADLDGDGTLEPLEVQLSGADAGQAGQSMGQPIRDWIKTSYATGDLDGDGYPEVVTADLDGDGAGEDLLLLPDGGGLIGDFDQDGLQDLVLSGAMLKLKSEKFNANLESETAGQRSGVATGAGAAAGAATLTPGDSGSGGQAIKSRDVLKEYFETGDVPTEDDFADLIDSMLAPGAGGPVPIEADLDGDGRFEPLSGIAIGDIDGDGTVDYMISTARRNQEQDNQDIADKTNAGIISPRDHASGLPTGKRQHMLLDLSGDGVPLDYEVLVLGDIDGDGLDDYALDKNTPFDIELTVGKGRGLAAPDASSGGSEAEAEAELRRDPPSGMATGKRTHKPFMADLDEDGIPDLLELSGEEPGSEDELARIIADIKVEIKEMAPVASAGTDKSTGGGGKNEEELLNPVDRRLALADLDRDGLQDLVVLSSGLSEAGWEGLSYPQLPAADAQNRDGATGGNDSVWLDLNSPLQAGAKAKAWMVNNYEVHIADVEGDGIPDLLEVSGGGIEEAMLLPAVQKIREAAARAKASARGVVPQQPGTYVFELVVTDNTGLQSEPQLMRSLGDLDGDGLEDTLVAGDDLDGDGIADWLVLGGGGGTEAGMLLPAVQKIREAAMKQALEFDLATGTDAQYIGMLLPAVQKVRDAANRSSGGALPADDFTGVSDSQLIGLLLPAVQKVREAAARSSMAGEMQLTEMDDETLIGLLLPAVQKAVSDAEPRGQAPMDGNFDLTTLDEEALIGLLLPAVQKVRAAAARRTATVDAQGPVALTVAGGDINGDGRADILIASGDLDGDGRSDLAFSGDSDRDGVADLQQDGFSLRDSSSGMASGKRQHKPIKIIKEWDASTPMLLRVAVGDINGDGAVDYATLGDVNGDLVADFDAEEEYLKYELENVMISSYQISGGSAQMGDGNVKSPRDSASGLPTGKRQHKPVSLGDLDGDGTDDLAQLADADGDGVQDFDAAAAFENGRYVLRAGVPLRFDPAVGAYDQNFRGGVRVAVGDLNGDGLEDFVTLGSVRGQETADEGMSTPSGGAEGATEYKDSLDTHPHKRPGRTKYSNIVLKRGLMEDGSDDSELSLAEADLDGDGVSERLLLSDTSGVFDPAKWQKLYSARISNSQQVKKVTVRGWDPEKKEQIMGEADGLIWSPRSNFAESTRQDFGQIKADRHRCSVVVTAGDIDGDGLDDQVALGDPPGGQPGDNEARLLAEQTKKMTIKERLASLPDVDEDGIPDYLDDDDDGDGIAELLIGDVDGDGQPDAAMAEGDIDGDGVGDFVVLSGKAGINETLPDTKLHLKTRHEMAKNAIRNMKGIMAPGGGSGGGGGGGTGATEATGFFKSVGGPKMETEVVDYQEGGVSGGSDKVAEIKREIETMEWREGMASRGGVYVASGDVNGDGVAEQVGSLSLSPGLRASTGGKGEIIIEADLDGDGEYEPLSGLAVAAELADPDLVLLESDLDGDGVLEPLRGIGIGDLDGDGAPDYVVSRGKNPPPTQVMALDNSVDMKTAGDNTPIVRGSALGGLNKDAKWLPGQPQYEDISLLSDDEIVALLLPAVQKLSEPDGGGDPESGKIGQGDVILSGATEAELIGMLLPAVQKVREAAAGASSGASERGGKLILQDMRLLTDTEVAALLLPAVQKIREAAARAVSPMAGGGRGFYALPEVDDEVLIGLLLPAVQKIRAAAVSGDEEAARKRPGRVKYSNITLKRGLIEADQEDGLYISGGGDAEELLEKLLSGQPEIVSNEKGLLSGPRVLGTADVDGDGTDDAIIDGDLDGDGSDDLAAYWPHMHQTGKSGLRGHRDVGGYRASLMGGGLELSPPDGTSDETKAFRARLTDFLGRPGSSSLLGQDVVLIPDQNDPGAMDSSGGGSGSSGTESRPGVGILKSQDSGSTWNSSDSTGNTYYIGSASGGVWKTTDGGGWTQTSSLAQFDADKIAELYDRLGKAGVGQPGDVYEEEADALADMLDEAEALVRAGIELQSQEGENILAALELLRRQQELCAQTENFRRRVEVLKSNKQGDPNANRGDDEPTLEFTAGEPILMNFELFFDTYEEGTAGEQLLEWIGELRAFDQLHRLTRGKKSKTYENMSDSDVARRGGGFQSPVETSAGNESSSGNAMGDLVKDTPRVAEPSFDGSGDSSAGPGIDHNLGTWVDSFDDMSAAMHETCRRFIRSRSGHLMTLDDRAGRLLPAVQKINDSVGEALEQARLMDEEWRRYEAANQTSQMQLLYLQFLKLEKSLLPELDDEVLVMAQYDEVVGDDCDDDCDGLDSLLRPQGLPSDDFESRHRREMGELLARAIGPDMEPDLYNLIPETMSSLEDLLLAAEQWEELVEILNKVAEDGEPIIGDVEELEDKLTGLLPPGDNPHFEPRLGLSDSDGDGLGDVTELDLGTDPTDPNDGGFIPLISPDDDDSVLFPETQELTFEFEQLESDKIEQYILVLEAEGQIFAVRDADDTEEVQLAQLVGPEGLFASAVDENGELHVEWHVEAQLDQSSNVGLPPGAFPNTVSSERRRLTIITPVQQQDIILDLSLESPTPIRAGDQMLVRGTISEVDSLGRWEIRLAYDPSLLRFVRGSRQGIFSSSTVFFGDQPGGILVISGVAPAGSSGLSGEGAIFDLEFETLQPGEGSIEGDSLDLFNIIDIRQDADFGEIVDFVIEAQGAAASNDGASPNGTPPGTPGKPGRRGGRG